MKILIPFVLLLASTSISPALAQDPLQGPSRLSVSYADLDLGRDVGVRKLDRRIRTAVQTACGTASEADLRGQNQIRRCRAETLARVALQRDRALASRQTAPARIALGN